MGRVRVYLVISAVISCVLFAPCSAQQGDDRSLVFFRGAKWGMSKIEITKYEGKEPIYGNVSEGINTIVFEDKALNMHVQVIYCFVQDKLVRAGYMYLEEHADKNQCVDDYRRVGEALKKRWGEPKQKDDKIWSDGLYKDNPKEWGLAVLGGHLRFECEWETAETEVVHSLAAANSKIEHGLIYFNKEFERLQQQTVREGSAKKPS